MCSSDLKQITFDNLCDPETVLEGDHNRLVQLFVNLFTNACDASRPGDRVEARSHRENGSVCVEVTDHGSGIPEDLREQVFEPFFTTKEPGEGTGLGLSLAYTIVSDHGGTIAIEGATGGGTRVLVRMPLVENLALQE